MLINRHGIKLFNEFDLQATLDNQLKNILKEIESDIRSNPPADRVEYIRTKVAEHQIKPLVFDPTGLTFTPRQEKIPAEYFPNSFLIERGEYYDKEVLSFHLPFTGDQILLQCVPNPRILWTEEVYVNRTTVDFDIINFNNDPASIKRDCDKIVNFLESQTKHINIQVNGFNVKLSKEIEQAIENISGKLSQSAKLYADIGIPMKTAQEFIQDTSAERKLPRAPSKVVDKKSMKFDVFICHASEDKPFVNKLAQALSDANLKVWYDNFQLGWGDDLRPAIDQGLSNSLFGIVIFSKSFLARKKMDRI